MDYLCYFCDHFNRYFFFFFLNFLTSFCVNFLWLAVKYFTYSLKNKDGDKNNKE